MTLRPIKHRCRSACSGARGGFVLIIVLWVALGLVTITLYFANSMGFELRASDNRVAGLSADEAIEGAARYARNVLLNSATNGAVPDTTMYLSEAVPVGDSYFWLLSRDTNQQAQVAQTTSPVFGLVDEASKLNLNTATAAMLEALPGMTPEFAAAIIDWKDTNEEISELGAESTSYALLRPAYLCKNTNFESVAELRLVAGATMDLLYGEDANLNGILDANENDGSASLPDDNRDGKLDSGILEYVTVYSRESNKRSDGSARINVSNQQGRQQLTSLLRERFEARRAQGIMTALGPAGTPFQSVMDFYIRSGMTGEEFAKIADDITNTNREFIEGLVNVNTASETVLACIPGIGTSNAATVVSFRQTNPDKLTSIAWVKEALDDDGPALRALARVDYITTRSYQFTADIAAVGPFGRGYRRARFVFDTMEASPKILCRQDLSHLGWALGRDVRQQLLLARTTP